MKSYSLCDFAASRRREEGLLAVVLLAVFAATALLAGFLEHRHNRATCAALSGQVEQRSAWDGTVAKEPIISLGLPSQRDESGK